MTRTSHILAGIVIAIASCGPVAGFHCEVTVSSYRTTLGRSKYLNKPTGATRCILVRGARRVLADAVDDAGRAALDVIDREIRAALQARYQIVDDESSTYDQVIVYHWGAMAPNHLDGRSSLPCFNVESLLSIMIGPHRVGRSDPEYDILLREACEPRYFVVISAYQVDGGRADRNLLLWRTHLSVSSSRMTQTAAIELLMEAGRTDISEDNGSVRRIIVNYNGHLGREP